MSTSKPDEPFGRALPRQAYELGNPRSSSRRSGRISNSGNLFHVWLRLKAATPLDGYKLKSGTVTVTSQSFDESHEFASTLRAFAAPAGFTGGTVFLTEPGGGPSDGFTLVSDPTTGLVSAYFISDGATAAEMSRFVTSTRTTSIEETGSFQDVSAFFGQAKGFAQITSDLDVPEPTIWALLILGFGVIGSAIRRHRSLAMFAVQ